MRQNSRNGRRDRKVARPLSFAAKSAAVACEPTTNRRSRCVRRVDSHVSEVQSQSVIDVANADDALTAPYQGRRRMTLTHPLLNRSRCILSLVTDHQKVDMVPRLYEGDRSIPAR